MTGNFMHSDGGGVDTKAEETLHLHDRLTASCQAEKSRFIALKIFNEPLQIEVGLF